MTIYTDVIFLNAPYAVIRIHKKQDFLKEMVCNRNADEYINVS